MQYYTVKPVQVPPVGAICFHRIKHRISKTKATPKRQSPKLIKFKEMFADRVKRKYIDLIENLCGGGEYTLKEI